MKKIFIHLALYALLPVLYQGSLGAMDLTKTTPTVKEAIHSEDQDLVKYMTCEPNEGSPLLEGIRGEESLPIGSLDENKEDSDSSRKRPREVIETNVAQGLPSEPLEKKSTLSAWTSEEINLMQLFKEDNCSELATLLNNSQIEVHKLFRGKNTLLHLAAYLGGALCVRLLLDRGLNQEATNSQGWTALHAASKAGKSDCVKVLLSNANKNAIAFNGQTPLDVAIDYHCIKLLQSSNAESFEEMSTNCKIRSALKHGKALCIRLLRTLKVDPNKTNNYTYIAAAPTPLHRALCFGENSLEVVQVLLALGANKESRNEHGETPLHIACQNKNGPAVALLLAHKANTETLTNTGETPLHFACDGNNPPPHLEYTAGETECIMALLSKKANPNTPNSTGDTPLHVACQSNNTGAVVLLLAHGANTETANNIQATPLHIACQKKNRGVVALLLEKMSAQAINKTDSDGETPLHCAAEVGSEECVQLLLEHGAKSEIINNLGETAYDAAKKAGRFTCIELLMDKSACRLHEHSLPIKIKLAQGNYVTVPAEIEAFSQLLSSVRLIQPEKEEASIESTDFISQETWNHIIELSPWLVFIIEQVNILDILEEDEDGNVVMEFDKVAIKFAQSYSSQDIGHIMRATNFLQMDCLCRLAQIAYGKALALETIARINSHPAELEQTILNSFIAALEEHKTTL